MEGLVAEVGDTFQQQSHLRLAETTRKVRARVRCGAVTTDVALCAHSPISRSLVETL